jgi:hypothetical protein
MKIENNLKLLKQNNFSMKLKMPIILLVLFLSIHISLAANSFNVTIISEKHDLTEHEAVIQVKNIEAANKDFNLRFIVENTSFDLSNIYDVYIYEYKPILKEFPIYATEFVNQTCYDLNEVGENISYDCSYYRNYQSGVEYKYRLDWKPTKMQLVKNSDKVSTDYGSITIPKSNSKCKYDDFNNSYDCDGTKLFKITWKTPVIKSNDGFGSKGYFAVADALTGINYDPWWNVNWQYRKPITIDNRQNPNTLTNYQVAINLTYSDGMQPDFDDIRFTWFNSTNNREELIPYWIENKSDSEWAYVWVKVPYIPGGSYTTIHVYYGNPNATSLSSVENTFRVINGIKGFWRFDEGDGNITYDSSENGNNGILYNGTTVCSNPPDVDCPTWVDGKFGKALRFDGVNDYVLNSSTNLPNNYNALTITMWLKPAIFQNSYAFVQGSARDKGLGIQLLSNNNLRVYFNINGTSSGQKTLTAGTYSLENWMFVVMKFDGVNGYLYKDGNLVGSISMNSSTVATDNRKVNIGRDPYYGGYFNGIIDEVMIFNRSLSDEDISDLYNGYGFTIADYPGSVVVRKYTSPKPTYYMGEATFIYDYNDLDKYIPALLVILLMAVVIKLVLVFKRWL